MEYKITRTGHLNAPVADLVGGVGGSEPPSDMRASVVGTIQTIEIRGEIKNHIKNMYSMIIRAI